MSSGIELQKLDRMELVAKSGLDAPPDVVLELIGEIRRLSGSASCYGCGLEGPIAEIRLHVHHCSAAGQSNPRCAYCDLPVAGMTELRTHVEFCPKHPIAAWKETAAQAQSNADYYRGLLVQCGEAFGDLAKTADDGKLGPDVLVAKLPELVRHMLIENDDLALK